MIMIIITLHCYSYSRRVMHQHYLCGINFMLLLYLVGFNRYSQFIFTGILESFRLWTLVHVDSLDVTLVCDDA